jgi:type II secretory pathway component HofQ
MGSALELRAAAAHNRLVRRLALVLALVAGVARAQSPDPAPAPAARDYIESVLGSERVPLRFHETPLADVVRTLQETVWLNIVVDPAVDRTLPVTHQSDGARPLGPALDALLAPLGLRWTVWSDVLYLHPRDQALPPDPGESPAGTLPVYTVHHTVVPFREALARLGALSGVRLEVTPKAAERAQSATVSLRVRNLPLRHLLTLLAHQVGLRWACSKEEGRVAWLFVEGEDLDAAKAEAARRLDAARVTATFEAAPLEVVAHALQAATGVEIRLADEVARDLSITLRVTDAPLAQALDALVAQHTLAWRREGTTVVVVKP